MAANDFITRASIWTLTEGGFNPLIVSQQNNILVVRYLREIYNKVLNECIKDLFCYNDGKVAMIFVLLENYFQIFQFDIAKRTIILRTTFNKHYDTASMISKPFVKLDGQYYDVDKQKFVDFKHDYTAISAPYALANKQQTYLFKDDNIIHIFPHALLATVLNFNEQYQIFTIQNVTHEYRQYSSKLMYANYYTLKAFGFFEYYISFTDVGDAVPEYFRVVHIICKYDAIIYQILVCFLVSEKCRLFSRYIMENATIKRHYLELHTNVRISRVFSSVLHQNVFTVTQQMFIVNGLRRCQRVVALKNRIDNVVFTEDDYLVFHGDSCSLINYKGQIVRNSDDFANARHASYFQNNLYVLFDSEIRKYNMQFYLVSHIQVRECVYFIVCYAGIFTFARCGDDLVVERVNQSEQEQPEPIAVIAKCAKCTFQCYAPMQLLILDGQQYSKILYIPALLRGLYAEAVLQDKLFTLDENGKLCAIYRTKYGNSYYYMETHASQISKQVLLILRIVPSFSAVPDIYQQFDYLNDAYSVSGSFIRFLALNQFNFVTQQTKFNKTDFPEWLYYYYCGFESTSGIPTVTLAQLFESELLYVVPIYHLGDLLFKAAQAEYKHSRDPNAIALYFILCGKNELLSNLYKIAQQQRISDFLRRDFSIDQNKYAAVKNAFTLVSQHKYALAIAWFVLGNDYFNAIKIAFAREHFNSPIFALRMFELFIVNERIPEKEIYQFTAWFDSNLTIERCNVKYFIDIFATDQILKRSFLKKEINFKRISYKLLSLLKQNITAADIDYVILFLLNAIIYYQNENVAYTVLLIMVALMLQFESPCIRKIYHYLCNWLRVEPNSILLNKIQNYRNVNVIHPEDISVERIQQQSALNFSKLARYSKIMAVFQYLYVSYPQYKTYDNQYYIMYYLLRNYRCHVYGYKPQTTLAIKQLVVLLFILFINNYFEAQNEYFADPLQQMANIYATMMTDNHDSVSITTFAELFTFIQNTWLTKTENLYFYNLLQNADQDDQYLLRLVIEETVLHWNSTMSNESLQAYLSQYIYQHSIESKINVFNVQQFKLRNIQQISVFSINPLLIIVFSERTLYVFDLVQHSSQFECLQIINCQQYHICNELLYTLTGGQVLPYVYDKAGRAFVRMPREKSVFSKQASSSTMDEKPAYDYVSGSLVKFHQNGQFFVALCSDKAYLTFLYHNNDNTYVAKYNFGKIVDFVVYDLHVYVMLEDNKRVNIYSFVISDIMAKRMRLELVSSSYPKATYLLAYKAQEGLRFALLYNGSLISVSERFDRQLFSVPLGTISSSFVIQNKNFCCLDTCLCVMSKEKRNVCLNCGYIQTGSKDILSYNHDSRVDIFWGDIK